MAELVASRRPHFRAAYVATHTPAADRLRERAEDLERLVEKFIEQHGRVQKENEELRKENGRLREELERLKGE